LLRLRSVELALVEGAAHPDPLHLPVDVAPLESEEFAEPHPGEGRREEERVVMGVEGVEEAVHLLGVEDLDLRIVVLPDRARPAERPAAVEAIHDEVAGFDRVGEEFVEDDEVVPQSLRPELPLLRGEIGVHLGDADRCERAVAEGGDELAVEDAPVSTRCRGLQVPQPLRPARRVLAEHCRRDLAIRPVVKRLQAFGKDPGRLLLRRPHGLALEARADVVSDRVVGTEPGPAVLQPDPLPIDRTLLTMHSLSLVVVFFFLSIDRPPFEVNAQKWIRLPRPTRPTSSAFLKTGRAGGSLLRPELP